MSRPKILLQLDADRHASVFDAVVAVDAGVDHLLQYAGVDAAQVQGLVHGAIFTRGLKDLRSTAVFIGGSDVAQGERLLRAVRDSFVGPLRVSVFLDANGANTTASAAVLVARRHVDLAGATAAVLAATGPVGQRAARLLARCGARVRVASRRLDRAELACAAIQQAVPAAQLSAHATTTPDKTAGVVADCDVLLAAGAAGIELVSTRLWRDHVRARVAIDLNAVPPAGLAPILPPDAGVARDGTICYGAVGVGGLKMRIHKAALGALFERNDAVLDAEDVFAIGTELDPGA